MAEMAVMNTEYAQAKIVIGSYEFLSEEHRIDSITINTGCYDGNVVSIGCAYTATCSIVMRNIEEISIGTKFEIYFLINEKWENFGKFWVNSRPTRSGELMTINAHGALGQSGNEPFWHPDMFYMNYSATIGQLLVGITEVSEMTSLLFDTDKDVSNFLNLYITVPIKEEYFSPHTNLNYAKSHGISKKDFLSGIAILFGGNVTERNGNVYIVPKVPDKTRKRVTFNRDSYTSDFNVSKETYGVQRVDIDYLPTKSISFIDYDSQKTYICQCYSGTERKKRQMFSSQENMQADVKYSTSIECDWIGYSSNALNYNCFTKDDLVYKIGNYNFIGYNENLYPGNIINIQDENGNEIPFYIGEMTLEWDGGFYTSISCNCNIDISKETYSTNSQSGISSSVNIISGMNYQNKTSFADITFSNVKDSTISGSKFINGSITGSKFADGTIENSKIKDSTITGSKFVDGTIENSKIKDSTLTGAKIADATIGFEKVNTSFIKDLTADKAYIDNLTARIGDFGFITADSADLKYATIESLQATDGKIDTLSSKAITTENISAKVAELGYLSAESAEIGYAKIDLSNVGTQVVSSSMIIDGAVTNEKVANLSANKITSGTIDASKITVTNLNADNLTVGTINGKLIGNGSVDLDKLSQEVPTKEYLDNVQKELQGQIDGAIETFTKSEIPTLNNEPANAWTDNETRKKHIGDVCYVLNPTSSADGYCYRFANTGTEASPQYEWVLIKDSDVTKALQDIIDINGEITGIKQFDTEISSWKTDTDAELSSLKSRTTTLETDMGSKVESSVFNEVKQTVDENSASIMSLSDTVSKKADGSTVETLTNTVNEVKQTADSNSLSISGMQTEIDKKADGSTVTELSTRTSKLEQNLDGFKTEVSKTYTTKTEFDNLEIGGRNLLTGTRPKSNPWVFTSSSTDYNNIMPGTGIIYVKPGKTYMISCESDGTWTDLHGGNSHAPSNKDCSLWIYLRKQGTTKPEFSWDSPIFLGRGYDFSCSEPSYKGRAIWKWTAPSDAYTIRIRFNTYSDGSTTMTVKMWNLKVEEGNKATDWSPAPEDTEESITEVKTIATQTADKFSWLVKSGTSATNFELTDRTATLVANHINLNGLVTFSGLGSDAQNKINSAENAVNNLEIGSRNLILSSKINETSNAYGFGGRNVVALENNTTYTFTVNGRINPSGNTDDKYLACFIYENSWGIFNYSFPIRETVNTTISHTFTTTSNVAGVQFHVAFYWYPRGGDRTGNATVNWCKLEKGNKATDWSPAPEDISVENIYTPNTTTIDGGKITTGSIKAAQISSGAITTDKLAANAVTAEKINVSDLFAQDITATGTITGATLKGANADIQKGFIGPFAISDSGMNYTGDNYSFAIEKNGIEISDRIQNAFTRNVFITSDIIQMDNKYCMATIREDYHTEDATHPFSFEVSRFLDGSGGSYTYKQTESTWYTIDGIHTQVLKDRSDGVIEINTSSFLMDVMSLDVSGVINSQRGFECNTTEGFAFLSADSEGGKLQLKGSGNKYEIDAAGGILRFIDATENMEIALLNSNGFYPKGEIVVAPNKTIRFGNYQSDYMIRGTDNSITIGDKDENGNSGYVNFQGDTRVLTGSFNAPTIKEGGVSLSNKYCYYQEGTGSVSGGASWKAVTVAFPVEYKTKPFVMVVQNCATTTENIWVTEVTTQGIAFQMHVPTSGWTYEYRWMAIGIKK